MMTERKWTPGPWSVPEKYPSEVEMPNGDSLASCWHEKAVGQKINLIGIAPVSLEESAANAHLIAAAPDLYDALDRIVLDWDGEPEDMAEARAALAKARGEQ